MATRYQITNAGELAANNAGNAGPKVDLTTFKVATDTGFTPQPTDINVHGTILYTGVISAYTVIDANTVEFSCYMDETVGDFTYGNIGLFTSTGALYCLGCLQAPQFKKATDGTTTGSSVAEIVRLRRDGLAAVFTYTVQQLNEAKMLEAESVDVLQPPMSSPSNAYITHSRTANGDQVLATRINDWLWDLSTHTSIYAGVTTGAGGINSLTCTNIGLSIPTFVAGDYIVQFTNGAFQGYCRMVTGKAANTLTWAATFPSAVPAGMAFTLYKSRAAAIDSGTVIDPADYYTKIESDDRYLPIGTVIPAKGIGGMQAFVNPGTFTFTVPAGVTKVWVSGIGGGGGTTTVGSGDSGYWTDCYDQDTWRLLYPGYYTGGALSNLVTDRFGSWGQSCYRYPVIVTPGATITITVGAGGMGCYQYFSAPPATSGGITSFGSLLTLAGGPAAVFTDLGALNGSRFNTIQLPPKLGVLDGSVGVSLPKIRQKVVQGGRWNQWNPTTPQDYPVYYGQPGFGLGYHTGMTDDAAWMNQMQSGYSGLLIVEW